MQSDRLLQDFLGEPTYQSFGDLLVKWHQFPSERSPPDYDDESSFDTRNHDPIDAIQCVKSEVFKKINHPNTESDLANCLNIGVEALEFLYKVAGFDPRTALERHDMLPIALLSREFLEREWDPLRRTAIDAWRDATKAFVNGSSVAAIMICRSLYEAVLWNHLVSDQGKSLLRRAAHSDWVPPASDMIKHCDILPERVRKSFNDDLKLMHGFVHRSVGRSKENDDAAIAIRCLEGALRLISYIPKGRP
jgi:hypothetical protein